MWTVKEGQKAVASNTVAESLKELTEWKSRAEELDRWAESLSDLASNSMLENRAFHSQASGLKIDTSGSGSFIVVKARGELHLDRNWSDLTEDQHKSYSATRAYYAQKSAFRHAVKEQFFRAAKGDIETKTSVAKKLNVYRVGAATLVSQATEGYTFSRVNGRDVIFTDTPLPLVATPPELPPDVLAALVKKLRDLEGRIRELELPANRWENLAYAHIDPVISVGVDNPPGDNFQLKPGEKKLTDPLSPVFGKKILMAWVERLNNLGNSQTFEVVAEVVQDNRVRLHLRADSSPGGRNAQFRVHVVYWKE